ncbi:unnamed protein product [Nezara viridula]|uniref:Ubiquitin carboxyl-terminal hydrolase n=1 Tax=Nezara viridula TaxID=85310 RepID=A0A9P0H709_NEZVI|nr:unnamed protein product [Nezara viridula]
MIESAIAGLTPHLSKIKIPTSSDKVYKDECVYSFDSPDSETGLYVCLQTFIGVGKDFVLRHFKRTGSAVYLHLLRDRIEKENKQGDGPERKVTKLAIGIEGGFEPDKKDIVTTETLSIVVLPEFISIPWPCDKLPLVVVQSVEGVLAASSALKMAELESVAGTWDGEARSVSRHAANLLQIDNGVKIPPNGWKCEECELDSNLWLNLTDGKILCGRRFFDGTGGNEHALQHYKKTGYPLAVKLGTITKEGKGDVYSYEEDDMVEDPYLIQHLAHFGINIMNLEKTEKSMAELELALNTNYKEWSGTEDGKSVSGPGLTGLANMGNSCYLNSVVQIIFSIPDFIKKYYENADAVFDNAPVDPAVDFNVQMAKLATGLISGKYAQSDNSDQPERKIIPPVTPIMFKNVIGRGHPDFSTKNQQDAHEFFLHLLTFVQRNSRGSLDPTECFKLQVEDRFECGATGKVKYTRRTEYCLPLSIPLSQEQLAAVKAQSMNKDSKDFTRPHIDLNACLSSFLQTELVEQFYSTAIQDKTTAKKTTRLATFPDYLMIHLKKFCLNDNWIPIKLDVSVDMPNEVDFKMLGRHQRPPGEELLPEPVGPIAPPVLDQAVINGLVEQGFPLEAAKKAAYFTKGGGIEMAVNWLMEHIADQDLNDPFVVPGAEPVIKEFIPDEEGLMMLTSMGFTRAQATKALKATGNNVERAGDWIFSHADELDKVDDVEHPPVAGETFRDGSSTYRLIGVISHMGPSSMVGHYICHVLKDGQWVIFNDEKVAFSENIPKNLGYLYLYQRV